MWKIFRISIGIGIWACGTKQFTKKKWHIIFLLSFLCFDMKPLIWITIMTASSQSSWMHFNRFNIKIIGHNLAKSHLSSKPSERRQLHRNLLTQFYAVNIIGKNFWHIGRNWHKTIRKITVSVTEIYFCHTRFHLYSV